MAENYKEGDKYYLPVVVDKIDTDYEFPVKLWFNDGDTGDHADVKDAPNLLLTADEITIRAQDGYNARYEELRKLYERDVTKLGGEIKTLRYENARLSKQNEELGTKVDDLEAGINNATRIADNAVETAQNKEKLIGEQRELIKKYGMVIDTLLDKITALKKGESNG